MAILLCGPSSPPSSPRTTRAAAQFFTGRDVFDVCQCPQSRRLGGRRLNVDAPRRCRSPPSPSGRPFAGKSPWRMARARRTCPTRRAARTRSSARSSSTTSRARRRRSRREARNAMKKLRTIKHPYLVKCLDAGEINDQKGAGRSTSSPSRCSRSRRCAPSCSRRRRRSCGACTHSPPPSTSSTSTARSSTARCRSRRSSSTAGWTGSSAASSCAPPPTPPTPRTSARARSSSRSACSRRSWRAATWRRSAASRWWPTGGPSAARRSRCSARTIRSPSDLKNVGEMPELLRPDYMRLLSGNPAARLRPAELLQNALFDEDYVSLQLFLETLNIKDAVEKDRFFTKLADRVPGAAEGHRAVEGAPRAVQLTRSTAAAPRARSSRSSRSPACSPRRRCRSRSATRNSGAIRAQIRAQFCAIILAELFRRPSSLHRWCPPSSSSSPTPTARCGSRCSSGSPPSSRTSPPRRSTMRSSRRARRARPPATVATAHRPSAPAPPPPPPPQPPPQAGSSSAQHISLGFVDTSAVLRELTVKAIVSRRSCARTR